jgi:putative ABC transport system permease protein
VEAATATSDLPGQGFVKGLVIPEGYTSQDNIFVPWVSVDYTFLATFHIPLVAGRDFSKAQGTDHLNAFILSESAVKSFGWKSPADAIGKHIIRGEQATGKKGYVVGVIRDFNFNTLDQPMQPLIMDVNAPRFTQFAIRIQADHVPETVAYVHKVWDHWFPERVFESSFLDRDINALYNDKERLSRMMEYFSTIAILLSAIGLFSLATFLSVQRTKEIGIRKVLGATEFQIISLLSGDFLALCGIAFIIAAPIAWFIMNQWLSNYANRVDIPWWIFGLAGFLGFFITSMSVGLQALKAARANPVKSLRAE